MSDAVDASAHAKIEFHVKIEPIAADTMTDEPLWPIIETTPLNHIARQTTMSLRVAFSGGPLDRMIIDAGDEERSADPWHFLPRYVFRATHHGRVGASFDIFNPQDLPVAVPVSRPLLLHQYRIHQRHIADDATILVMAGHVGATGRAIMPTPEAIYEWAG